MLVSCDYHVTQQSALRCCSPTKEGVDVNVTPDKRKVMVHQEKALLALVKVRRESERERERERERRNGGKMMVVCVGISRADVRIATEAARQTRPS